MISEILVGRPRQRGHALPRDRAFWLHNEHVAVELQFEHRFVPPSGMEHTAVWRQFYHDLYQCSQGRAAAVGFAWAPR